MEPLYWMLGAPRDRARPDRRNDADDREERLKPAADTDCAKIRAAGGQPPVVCLVSGLNVAMTTVPVDAARVTLH